MRDEHVTALEQSCSPIQLITGLGFDPIKSGDQYTITCPSCHNRLFVLREGFLCENIDCSFRAGGVVDLLKTQEQLPDYVSAISRLEEIFPSLFKGQLHTHDAKTRMRVATRLNARRNLFELLRLMAKEQPRNSHDVTTKNKLRKAFGDQPVAASPYAVFPLWRKHYKQLQTILTQYGERNPPNFDLEDAPFLVPYFSNHHTVGVLGFHADIDREYEYRVLEPSKYQFFGLMQAHPKTQNVYLTSGFRLALLKNAEFSQKDPTQLALHCTMKGSENRISWVPKAATYLETKRNRWSPIITLGLDIPISVARGTTLNSVTTPLQDHIVHVLVSKIIAEGFNADVEYLLELCQLYKDVHIMALIRKDLEDAGRLDELNQLQSFLRHKVLSVEGDEKLYQAEEGYFYARRGVDVGLSNFSLDFHRSIRFHNSSEVYYEVDLRYSERSIPMLLSHQNLHQPRLLEQSLQQFPNKDVELDKLQGLPVLYEVAGRKAGMLLRYFKRLTSSLPIAEGINSLGWSVDRKRFHGPNWIADPGGIRHNPLVFSPGNEMLKLFVSEDRPVRKVHQQLPLDITHIIAQTLGLVFRSYHNVGLMAIPILREGQGENLLRGLFREMGQRGPLHFNENQWIRSVDVHGFPVYGTGCDYRKTQNVKQAVFMLTSDRGQRIDTEYSEEIFEKAGQTFRQVFHECVAWMLEGEDVSFENHRSVDPNFILAKEGARVIQRAMGIEWHIHTPAYNVLDTLLANIPFERTQDYMVLDLNKRMFELKLDGLPAVDATDLQLELSQFANGVILTEHGVAANDADMNRLITNYYQETPRVEQLFVPPVLTDT